MSFHRQRRGTFEDDEMKVFESIVAATDVTSSGDSAVRTAVTLATLFQSQILLLHAVPQEVYSRLCDGSGIPEIECRLLARRLEIKAGDVAGAEHGISSLERHVLRRRRSTLCLSWANAGG